MIRIYDIWDFALAIGLGLVMFSIELYAEFKGW